jgi:polyribonucleotide nucleotidyltransferase
VAASAALCASDIPFKGPTASVKMGMDSTSGSLVVNPTAAQLQQSPLCLLYAGIRDRAVSRMCMGCECVLGGGGRREDGGADAGGGVAS